MTQKLDDIIAIHDEIAEYSYLETDLYTRRKQRRLFLDDKNWNPLYTYPRLVKFLRQGELMGGMSYDDMRHFAIDAIRSIEHARQAGDLNSSAARLYADFYVARLQRLLLLKTAQEMAEPHAPSRKRVLQHRFMRLNQELYGQLDVAAWHKLMSAEKQRLLRVMGRPYVPQHVSDLLLDVYGRVSHETPAPELIDEDLAAIYKPLVTERYQHILQMVPDTGPEVVYDAVQCARIMQHALMAGGFRGWSVAIDAKKCNPSTEATGKRILLPASTRRTAQELRRLILHEQEVHARRAENGRTYANLAVLRTGTANYSPVEEGLGVFLETMLTGSADSPAIFRAQDRYITAGIILGLERGRPRDARRTYEIVWRILTVRHLERGDALRTEDMHRIKLQAYTHIENAFRGTDFASPGIFYMKLKVYYEGLLKNVAFMRSIAGNLDRFDAVFAGKYDHTSATEYQLVQDALDIPQVGMLQRLSQAFKGV